jgi:hypothetical protein
MKFSFKLAMLGVTFISFFEPQKVLAEQFYYSSPSHQFSPSSNEGSFSVHADSMSCSSGGGTTPSLFAGVHSGQDGYGVDKHRFEDDANTSGDFVSGLVGFNIPLGSPGNKGTNCEALLAVVEADEFLKMLQKIKDLGIVDDHKIEKALFSFLDKRSQHLGEDIVDALSSGLKSE